jgi:hypothetical protein
VVRPQAVAPHTVPAPKQLMAVQQAPPRQKPDLQTSWAWW